ncbi:hypothetical protein [uncultured Dokdonia sp.]|uniref:hypothetical protein n=1 Tax=uncultured Dokdonia sp. TaxID=575653 RepID=UPI002610A533|nr:hypothetical protein [uncultured Dokdonia sp.]
MKYLSLIDELSITIETIRFINAYRIEQIQKQLEFEATLDSSIKITELSQLVSQLENSIVRDGTIFIEQHLWLKNILLENYNLIDDTSFNATYDPRAITDETKTYITPFILEALTPALHYFFKEEKFKLLARVVSLKRFFSDEVQQEIVTFFKRQLNVAKNYITEGKLKESQTPISFLNNAGFVESVNLYVEEVSQELTAINSVIVRTYNLNQSTRNNEWAFAISTMIAFGKLSFPNQQQQEVFTKNASMAKSSKFNTDVVSFNTSNPKRTNSKTTYTIIAFASVIFIAALVSLPFINRNTTPYNDEYTEEYSFGEMIKDYESDQENSYTDSEEEIPILEEDRTIEATISEPAIGEDIPKTNEEERVIVPGYTTLSEKTKNRTQDTHIRFLYSLKNKVLRGDDQDAKRIITVTPFTNPYPKTFNTIQTNPDTNNEQLKITNRTKKHLVIFKLQNGIDEAIVIPKENNAILNFKQGDSIAFYAGTDFTVTKFSHFTREQDISNLYEIKSLAKDAHIEVTFKGNSGSKKNSKYRRTIESLELHHVEAKKLKPIESLYTEYYNAYYNK